MTTIYVDQRERKIYADKQQTDSGVKTEATKLRIGYFKKNNSFLFADTGSVDDTNKIFNFLQTLDGLEDLHNLSLKKPKNLKNAECFVIPAWPYGQVYTITHTLIPTLREEEYWAIGAGWREAMVLLDAGGIEPWEIFAIINNRTTHTSKEFDVWDY